MDVKLQVDSGRGLLYRVKGGVRILPGRRNERTYCYELEGDDLRHRPVSLNREYGRISSAFSHRHRRYTYRVWELPTLVMMPHENPYARQYHPRRL